MTRTGLVLLLLLLSSLIMPQPVMSQGCGAANGDLYNLPACAVDVSAGGLRPSLADFAYLTSATPQSAIALPGQSLSFTISYQVWASSAIWQCSGLPCRVMLLFYASWAPWPPTTNASWSIVYSGYPGPGPPGTKDSASLHLTAPIAPGIYYVWFCAAVGETRAEELERPKTPAHIKIIVPAHTSTLTVTAMIPGALTSSPLTIPLIAAGVGGVAVAVALASSVLVTKRRRRSARVGFANVDELLLSVNTEVPKQDRVLATVMFTDIVGSTQRAAKVGDTEWRDLLGRHFDLIRKELDRFHGREIGTTGDGMLAVFADPERAVRCACSIRDSIRSLGLELRIGLHTGNVQLTTMAGLDHVAGIAVHIGARVASQAEPGEILVSGTTKDLVTGSGVQFKDCGVRALKGVPGEWHLFAVTGT